MLAMVDNIRKSVENLEAPACPHCARPMLWVWSQLVEYSPVVVEHEFVCDACGGTTRLKHIRADQHIKPPGKLSLPRMRSAA